ncbi:hypothetical protein ONS95_000043 [Cadophora gregata]|uniref:uncharacterized protein n=1 Tax=Cadophora gregata TaxID=51156 RepID=UPI0026DA77C4|nr:uncharacterized protein ONS95_000043 [Cadophora gregata]KAK0115690.1 hypothetical protein ONS96_014135 [Cadophora gregata f. sp. sojae]KAK0128058.1 hypothetical protein ONS95_000043 [Cadophora gregata]
MEPTGPLSSFPSFPLLPFEIRLKIWEYCLPPPRVIKVEHIRAFSQQDDDPILKAVPCHCAALCDVYPSIAAVSSESRTIFLSHFSFCFGTHVSWENDTIYLNWDLSHKAHLPDSSARKILDAFTATVLASPGGARMASLAMNWHYRWVRLVLRDPHNHMAPAKSSLFDHFPNMKEFLVINGRIGLFKILPDLTPETWPYYDAVPYGEEMFRPGSHEICMRADDSDVRFWPTGSGIKLKEANSTDEVVWSGDPTEVAQDFVREMYEVGGWGDGGRKPFVKIVGMRVLTGSCFKDGQQVIGGVVEGQRQLREDIVFQKNELFTC